jgi:hypothetical protein
VVQRNASVGLLAAAGALVVVSLVYMAVSEAVTDAALAWAQWACIAVVIALLLPVGLLLGVFLPAGIDAAVAAAGGDTATEGRLVAWCWAVNGFFSVIGSSLTTIISMSVGFNRALLVGLALYVVAVLVATTQRGVQSAAD